MAKDPLSRKLAVILHADVVASTKLVQKNEVIAHERMQDTFNRFSKTVFPHLLKMKKEMGMLRQLSPK